MLLFHVKLRVPGAAALRADVSVEWWWPTRVVDEEGDDFMAERRRRGLGRGLGALINSDSQEAEASGATAHAVPVDVPRETSAAENGVLGPNELDEQVAPPQTAEGENVPSGDSPPATAGGPAVYSVKDPIPTPSEGGGSIPAASDGYLPHETTAPAQGSAPSTERPIDVFFSAKSHLGTHRVSRETRPVTPSSTMSRRTAGRRAEMPDVLSERSPHRGSSARSAASPPIPAEVQDPPPQASASGEEESITADTETSHAWTDGVSRGTVQEVEGAEFRAVPVHSIRPNPRQPRQEFDEDDMAELVHSVREIGVLQPIVVRPLPGTDEFELVMGERRWRASMAAEHPEIPAIVRHTKDDDLLRDALLENIHRSQLNPLEEAAAYRQLLDDFDCTQDELAEKIGRSRPQISNTLRLMKLPAPVQRRVAAGVLSSGHARALLGMSSAEDMETLAQRIVSEGLSVRATEENVAVAQHDASTNGVSRGTASRLPSTARYQQLDEYAEALTDRLDTQVKITLGAKKGRIAIDFGSIEDLHRLMEMIGDKEPAR